MEHLTKREMLAALALQGFYAGRVYENAQSHELDFARRAARNAVRAADALILELGDQPEQAQS